MGISRAPLIALWGPDGSGKSTIADLFVKRCEGNGINTTRMHWRPGILPYRRIDKSVLYENRFKPHETKSRQGLTALLILLYVTLDFILGYYFLILPQLRKGTIVIYERYYMDLVFDQQRYGLKLPLWVRVIFSKLVPSPDKMVLLDAPTQVLYARKKELDLQEIERQRQVMRKIITLCDCYQIIDSSKQSPDEIVDFLIDFFEINRE